MATTTAIALQIVDQRRRQAQLLDAERRFRGIFDHAFQFIGLLDVSGVLERNSACFPGPSPIDPSHRPVGSALPPAVCPSRVDSPR